MCIFNPFFKTLKVLIQTAKQPVIVCDSLMVIISFTYMIKFLNALTHTKTTNPTSPLPVEILFKPRTSVGGEYFKRCIYDNVSLLSGKDP